MEALAFDPVMRRIGLVVAAVSLCASSAFAQDAAKQKQADALFEEGRKLLTAAPPNPEGACGKFNEAIKLDPLAPGIMLNLGLCNEKLSRYKTALYWFRKAQARAAETNPPLPEYEKAAKDHTIELANKVATIKIQFASPPPADARVKIDGEDIKPDEYLHAEVDPGDHTLVAGAQGKKIVTQQFSIEKESRGGQTMTIEFVDGTNTIVLDPGASRRKAAVILAISGGVLWGGALGVSLWSKGHYSDYATDGKLNDTLPAGVSPQQATDEANKWQHRARWWGTPLFVGGALAISGSIVMYLTAPQRERIDQTVFVPMLTPDGLGFAASGRF